MLLSSVRYTTRRAFRPDSAVVICQACGSYNPEGNLTCLNCRAPLPTQRATQEGGARCRTHPELVAAGTCTRCGTFYCANCLTPRGADYLCATCLERFGGLPWDERETIGTWRAWWRTSLAMISSPTVTLQSARPDAPMGSSVMFALISTLVGYGPTLVLYGAAFVPIVMLAGKESGRDAKLGLLGPVFFLAYLAVLMVMQVVFVFVLAGIDHLALLLVGAQPRSYATTMRANALSMGVYLLGLVPVCSFYVFPIWALVLRIIALMHLHRTTAGKAALAVLLPLVLFCGLCGIGYASLIGLGAMAAGR